MIFPYNFPRNSPNSPQCSAFAPSSPTSSAAAAWRRCRRPPPRATDGPPHPLGAGRGRWGCVGWPWHLGGMGKPSFPKSKKAIPRFQGDLRISGLRWFKVWPKSTCAPEFGRNNDVIHTLIHHLPPYPPLATSSHHYHHYHRFPMFGQTQMVEEKCETGFPRFQPLFNNI